MLCTLVSRLSKHVSYKQIERWLDKAHEIASSQLSHSDEIYRILAKITGDFGDMRLATKTYELVEEHSTKFLTSQGRAATLPGIAIALYKSGDHQGAIDTLINLERLHNDYEVRYEIIKSYLEIGFIDHAIDRIKSLAETPLYSRAIYHIVQNLGALGEFDRALDFANNIPNPVDRFSALSNLAIALAKRGYIEKSQNLLDGAEKQITSQSIYKNKKRALSSLCSLLFLSLESELAIKIIEHDKESKDEILKSAILLCLDYNRSDIALDLTKTYLKGEKYQDMLFLLLDYTGTEQILTYMQELQTAPLRKIARVIDIALELENINIALEWTQRIFDRPEIRGGNYYDIKMDEFDNLVSDLFVKLCQNKQIDEIQTLASKIVQTISYLLAKSESSQVRVAQSSRALAAHLEQWLTSLISLLAKADLYNEALKLVSYASSKASHTTMLRDIIKSIIEKGQASEQFWAFIASLSPSKVNIDQIYETIAISSTTTGLYPLALKFASEIKDHYQKIDVLSQCIKLLVDADVFEIALEFAANIGEPDRRVIALYQIGQSAINTNKAEYAGRIIAQIEQENTDSLNLLPQQRETIRRNQALLYGNLGEFAKLAKIIDGLNFKDDVYKELVIFYQKRNDLERANQFISELSTFEAQLPLLLQQARYLHNSNLKQQAVA